MSHVVYLNKLSLNVSKTNFMLFTNSKCETAIHISINNINIDMVSKTKFLGVLIDNKLNWKEHIAMIKSKLSKSLAIMYRAKWFFRQKCLHDFILCSISSVYILLL